MLERDPAARLEQLVATGALRIIYVVGVTRSASTLVCRLLGARLDGAVYEPAMPVAPSPSRHWATVILRAYRRARRRKAQGTVVLAVKDVAIFVEPAMADFIAAHAAHVVLTIRDPRAQFPSLKRQLRGEFTVRHRVRIIFTHPFEALWFFVRFLQHGPAMVRTAAVVCGGGGRDLPELGAAGWDLRDWHALAALHDRLAAARGGDRLTVLDADQLRADTGAATAILDGLAPSAPAPSSLPPLEVVGHSRMGRRSSWAAEALASTSIKPAPPAASPQPRTPVAARLFAELAPIYARLRASPANRLTPGPAPAADVGA